MGYHLQHCTNSPEPVFYCWVIPRGRLIASPTGGGRSSYRLSYISASIKIPANPFWGMTGIFYLFPNCQKATALAAATFKESTPWDMGIFTV